MACVNHFPFLPQKLNWDKERTYCFYAERLGEETKASIITAHFTRLEKGIEDKHNNMDVCIVLADSLEQIYPNANTSVQSAQ